MKNKIKHFSKGEFQIKKPVIVFETTFLTLKIGEGEIYKGSFTIGNESDGEIRGLVYPSSFRMQCKEQGFEGETVTIHFTYDGRGFKPGHVEHGKFTVVCNGGEYEIGFAAIIEKPFVMTSQGRIQDLRGFKKLAYKNHEEAVKIFRSRDFFEIIKYEDAKVKNLYSNMRKWSLNDRGMEEFLVGIKQKEKIFLELEAGERSYKNIEGAFKDNVKISKNTWGYMDIEVSCEGDFIELSKTSIYNEEFRGLEFDYEYSIRSAYLHAGKNLGEIIFKTPYEEIHFQIEVSNSSGERVDNRQADYCMAHIYKSYIQFEAGKSNAEDWIRKVTKLINELQMLEPENNMYKLLQAHAYLIVHQSDEAKWILESYNYSKFPLGRNVEADAYYLFLMALQKKEVTYTKKAVEEIQKLYLKYSGSWKILCMLIQIDGYYNDYFERIHALENQFNMRANHLLIYLEAYKCYRNRSNNLKKLGDFEIQVLRFAVKYQVITKDIALYTANLASQQKHFDKKVFDILAKAYQMFPDPMILAAICTILIKGNKIETKYFKWYEKAVLEDIKVARLFEYYMASIDPRNVKGALPRTVHLYFAHGNALSYDKVALLYSNLITYEDNSSELFGYYDEKMKIFAMEQLELRRVNPQLRIIYRKYLSTEEINIEKIKAIYDICHAYLLTTNAKNIKYVLVIEADGTVHQRVPYSDSGAQVILDSSDDIIVWESKSGEYFIDSIKYETKRLFYELKFVEMCKIHLEQILPEKKEEVVEELSYESLKKYGVSAYKIDEVFELCSSLVVEAELEDDHLTYICFELFRQEQYDANTLEYLTNYYCGATRDMKEIWYAAQDYEVETFKLSERIITQMIFSEVMFGEDEIFEDYYKKGAYFRLEEAYIAFASREYVMKNRELSPKIIKIIMFELSGSRERADVVKIAVLKYFSQNEYTKKEKEILKRCMQELCEKQIYFSFYMNYGEEWLREVQLWDKTIVTYVSKLGGKVKVLYQLQKEGEESLEYESEILVPMYENIYVKKFVIYKDEVLKYYFKETSGEQTIRSEKKIHRINNKNYEIGKYGKLNGIIEESLIDINKMKKFALEEALAEKIFVPYI